MNEPKKYVENLTEEKVKDRVITVIMENVDILIANLARKYGINVFVDIKIDVARKVTPSIITKADMH
jgi:hypothetical protein